MMDGVGMMMMSMKQQDEGREMSPSNKQQRGHQQNRHEVEEERNKQEPRKNRDSGSETDDEDATENADDSNGDGKAAVSEEESEASSNELPEERIRKAIAYKEEGNVLFKQGSCVEAKKYYSKGLRNLKNLDVPEVTDIRKTLNLNISACYIRLGEWFSAIQALNEVLKDDPHNIKALYRRGYSRSQFGLWEEGKADLAEVLKLDENNPDARREYVIVSQKIKNHIEQNKKAYCGLFNKGGRSLYSDREKELEKRKEAEREERNRLRELWHTEMNGRKANGEEEISFEKWHEEYKKKEDTEARKNEERRDKQSENNKPASSKNVTSSNAEMDDEDEKIILDTKKMGYCYFRRELTEAEKMQNALNQPKKLNVTAGENVNNTPKSNDSNLGENANFANLQHKSMGVSSWNSAGTTYEEKDVSNWATDRITHFLLKCGAFYSPESLLKDSNKLLDLFKDVTTSADINNLNNPEVIGRLGSKLYEISVATKSVKEISGEAHVAIIRGTKRYIFDFNITLSFECTVDVAPQLSQISDDHSFPKNNKHTYNGELHLPEVTSAAEEKRQLISESSIKFNKDIRMEHKDCINMIMQRYKEQLIVQINMFLEDFKHTH